MCSCQRETKFNFQARLLLPKAAGQKLWSRDKGSCFLWTTHQHLLKEAQAAAPATSSCQASAENHSQRSSVFIVHRKDQGQQKIIMICFEHEQDVNCGKSLPLYFSVLGHFLYSSGLFPPWGLCHRFHRSYHCSPGLSGIQKPSSHCTAVPGADPAHQGSGFFLKREQCHYYSFYTLNPVEK